MLFLRDIDADVQLRCRACGHGGVLPRAMLERRFGPNYPVLSIAPHYRCSRCDSRDIESRPILAEPPTAGLPAASNDEPSFDAPLAALNGLLASLRGGDGGRDRTADAEPPPPPPSPPPAPVRGKPVSELPLSDLVADGPAEDGAAPLWEPVSLADMAARLGRPSPADDWPNDWDDEPAAGDARTAANDEGPEPARDEVADTADPDGAESEDGDPDDDGDETLMAMRRLLAQAYGSDDDEDDPAPEPRAGRAASFAEPPSFGGPVGDRPDPREDEQDEPPVFSHKVLVRRDFEDDGADAGTDPWQPESGDGGREDDLEDGGSDGEEPSEEEILSFAIRDPEKPIPASASRPAKPAAPPAEPLDFDQHRAERRAQRPPPPPEDEEGFDRTLAALRSMIEDAANEPAEEEEDAAPPPKGPRDAGRMVDKPARREEPDDPAPDRGEDDWSPPTGWGEPDPAPEAAAPEQEKDPEPAPAGRRSAQEREVEEAMKALRGLIEDEVQRDSPPASQPKPRAAKPRPPARSGSAAPEAGTPPDAKPPDVHPETAKPATPETKPAGEPTPLSKTIAALRGMLELDGRRKR
ncbi:hypothetical protein [Azospirillum sp. Sh1]|uniref:hypothetical protein n=1 Tax=Azospirillum sp. Sh1 TaxID=2607285 RepID=UPI0011F032C1|nr:hypothetical protein [Azospirillum sp. Sh1]KAA0575544.1 hypothetical protein FZ029_15015 [Azospirillum sp. Sh1]